MCKRPSHCLIVDDQKTERENRVLEQLIGMSGILLGSRSLQEALDCIAKGVQGLGFNRSRLFLLSEDRQKLTRKAQSDEREPFVGTEKLAKDDPYFQLLCQTRRPHLFKRGECSLASADNSPDKEGVDEWICAPLIWGGTVIGKLSADNKYSRHPISEGDLEHLKLFASQAAAAVENIRLLENTQQRARQLETLRHLGLNLTSSLDLEIVLPTIVEEAAKLLNARNGGIYKYHSEREELAIIADYRRPTYEGKMLKVGEGMAGKLIQSHDRFSIVDDYNTWPGRSVNYGSNIPYPSLLQVKLTWQGHAIGVLYIGDVLGRRFTEEDAQLLGLFADQAASALVNAELATRDAKQLSRLERLSQATQEMMRDLGETTLDERLTLIAKCATEVLEAETCSICLVKQEGVLSLEASYGHAEGGFEKGQEFVIRTGDKTGLTGHIAHDGVLFNAHGQCLTEHPAVHNTQAPHLPSQQCHSLLAIPLKKKSGQEEKIVGLLRGDNKKDEDGRAHPFVRFTEEDERIIRIFADAAVVAIENAKLVEQLKEQKDHWARLVNSSPNGIIAVDTKGQIRQANKRAWEMLGYSEHDKKPTEVFDLYASRNEPHTIKKKLESAPDKKFTNYETVAKGKDGNPIPIRNSVTYLSNARGQSIGTVGHFEDLRPTLSLFLKASRILTPGESFQGRLQQLVEVMLLAIPHAFCQILLLDGDSEELTVAAVQATTLAGPHPWNAGRNLRIPVRDWLSLPKWFDKGVPTVLRQSDRYNSVHLDRYSRTLGLGEREAIQSLLMVPLKVEERIIGLINFGELQPEAQSSFSSVQIHIANALAGQVALLIDRMQQLETTEQQKQALRIQLQRRANALEAVYGTGRAVTASLNLRETLSQIGAHAWHLANQSQAAQDKRVAFAEIWLVENETVRLAESFPRGDYSRSEAGELLPLLPTTHIDFSSMNKGRIGIIGRAIKTATPQRVNNVADDPDYLEALRDTQSELAAPIKFGDNVIGAINIEHPDRDAFDDEDQHALDILADQAAIAIHNARQYEELKRTKGIVGARTAVAWIGMASAAWRHSIGNHASTIQDIVKRLDSQCEKGEEPDTLRQGLADIDDMAKRIRDTPLTAPLSAEEGVEAIRINDLIEERLSQLSAWHPDVLYQINPAPEEDITVKASPEWLKRALDLLVDNAITAMSEVEQRALTISTRVKDNVVEIAVSDTGPGIPGKVQEVLFREPIKKPKDSKGGGVGLLLAQTIVQTYGGDIRVASTSPAGTTMVMQFPLEVRTSASPLAPMPARVLLVSDPRGETAKEFRSFFTTLDVSTKDTVVEHPWRTSYDIIVIDATHVPGDATPLLISEIRQQHPGTKIIVITAAPDWALARETFRAGATEYMTKSLDTRELFATIDHILSQ